MSEPQSQPQPRWRVPWWWIAIGAILAVVGLTVAGLAIWVHTDGDLRRADARARAAGLAVTWEELGLRASPPDVLDTYDRLRQLCEANGSYQSAASWYQWKTGQAVPAGLVAHHAAQPAGLLDDIAALVAALPPEGVLRTDRVKHNSFSDFNWNCEASRWFAERMALARGAQALRVARVHAALIRAARSRALIDVWMLRQVETWRGAVVWSLRDPDCDREALAQECDALRAFLDQCLPGACRGELVFVRDVANQIVADDPAGIMVWGDIYWGRFPQWMVTTGAIRVLGRASRENLLRVMIDAVQVAHVQDLADRCAAARDLAQRRDALSEPRWHPRGIIPAILTRNILSVMGSWTQTDACLRVTAAELRGEPWPRDPTDPSGGQIRRIERDGRLIGFYLCGRNGGDDGGSRYSDNCFPLYEALGRPKASDPPPVP